MAVERLLEHPLDGILLFHTSSKGQMSTLNSSA